MFNDHYVGVQLCLWALMPFIHYFLYSCKLGCYVVNQSLTVSHLSLRKTETNMHNVNVQQYFTEMLCFYCSVYIETAARSHLACLTDYDICQHVADQRAVASLKFEEFCLVQCNAIKHVSIKLARIQDYDGIEKNTEFSGNTPCATFEVLNRSLLF